MQVMVVALLTGILTFPNKYTRSNASELIRVLFSQCGPEDNSDLWYIHTYVWWDRINVHMYMCVYVFPTLQLAFCDVRMYTCKYTCVHVCIVHVYAYIRTCLIMYMYIYF